MSNKNNPEPKAHPEKSSNKNSSPDDVRNFLTAKNYLITYYQNISSSQAVRLIAFSAGLFTLLGAIQVPAEKSLRVFFKDAPSIINFGLTPEGLASFKFVILFLTISILLFFIFRAIFRYTTYAIIANELIYVKKDDLTETSEKKSLHNKLNDEIVCRVTDKYPKKLFKCVKIDCFYSYSNNIHMWKGFVLSAIFSIISTFLLLLLIW